jgi:hypothetical protein
MTAPAPALEELMDEDLSTDLAATALALARRYHAGATLWVLSPEWEPHAHHVAVEFVHPVIVGKRALPAFALTGADPVGEARLATRPGDVVLVVAAADDLRIREVVRRAPAWGAETIWIGFGERPEAGAADHVLWVDSSDPMVPATGRFVLLYHLLWELTHVCFEHPGLLLDSGQDCTDDVCITCSDEGRLGEVVRPPLVRGEAALVRAGLGTELVDVTLIDEVAVGDLLLVHAGFALTRVDHPEGRS